MGAKILGIDLDELTVMQSDLRHPSIEDMIEFVSNGGFWTTEVLSKFAADAHTRVCPLMEIVLFEDGRYMVHDGHHRVVATWLGGRRYLRNDEFILKKWHYSNYQGINFDHHWVTPFDPRSEVRAPDISEFKKKALALALTDVDAAKEFIVENKYLYVKPRLFTGVSGLVDLYLCKNCDSYEQGDIDEFDFTGRYY